jgi:hypothetical protein
VVERKFHVIGEILWIVNGVLYRTTAKVEWQYLRERKQTEQNELENAEIDLFYIL